jgi:hypothetical protein
MPVWMLLAAANAIFYWKGSLAAKRRWHPRIAIAAGVLFAGFVALVFPEPRMLVLFLPAIALICFLNLKLIKFCGSCGATIMSNMALRPARFCQRCGAPLERSAG